MSEFVEKNKNYFDGMASAYNKTFEKTMKSIISEIQDRVDWIDVDWIEESSSDDDEPGGEDGEGSKSEGGKASSLLDSKKKVRVLDYACGTGLITRALAPYATHFTGVDISQNMVTQYNLHVSNQGIPSSEMHAIQANLLDPSDPSPAILSGIEYFNFDLAVVGLGFHHFEDPALAARRLAARLRVGGVLFVVDFLPHGGEQSGHGHEHSSSEDTKSHLHSKSETEAETGKGKGKGEGEGWQMKAKHTVIHMGFSKEDIEKMFVEAGVGGGFDYVEVGNGHVFEGCDWKGKRRGVFMARGTKL